MSLGRQPRSGNRPRAVALTMSMLFMSARKKPATSTPLTQARRVVVKVGSALLVDGRTGRLNRAWLESLIEDLLRLRRQRPGHDGIGYGQT